MTIMDSASSGWLLRALSRLDRNLLHVPMFFPVLTMGGQTLGPGAGNVTDNEPDEAGDGDGHGHGFELEDVAADDDSRLCTL